MRGAKTYIPAGFVSILLLPAALGQGTVSTIRGSAADPSGAAVAGAGIEITDVQTNIRRSVLSNGSGEFEVPDLASGIYRLSATTPGFKTFVAENIILESSQIRRIDVVFELGAVGSEVLVKADAAVITTDTAKIAGSFTNKRFEDAPWIGDGRNPQLVMTTLPLVQTSGGIYNIQLAGLPNSQVQTGIDGVPGDGSSLQASNAHVMQEVQIVTGNNSAEYSRAAFISLSTKSGTNSIHGRAMYWHQNSALSARGFFDARKAKNLFHTMDAQVSGPVRKDKTFFFGSWSGQRWPSSTFYLRDVPTAKMRQGDFADLLSLSRPVPIKDPLNGLPFPNNVIPANRLNATSLKIQDKYLPAPNLGAPDALANNFGFLFPHPTDLFRWDSYEIRIDHRFSDQNMISGHYLTSKPLYVLAGTFPAFTWTRVRDSRTLAIQDTHIFSPSLVNTFRWGLYQPNVIDGGEVSGIKPIQGNDVTKDLGIQGVNPKGLNEMGFPRIDITGYMSLRQQPGGLLQNDKSWDFAESLTWSKGRHVFKFGGEYRPQSQLSGTVPEGTYGIFTFNGTLTGYGAADFVLGLPYSSQRLDPLTNRTLLDSELGLYAQDTFKVNPRLSLDLGLRWDKFGSATYDDGLIYNWDPATGNVIVPSAAMKSISPLYPANTIKTATGNAGQNPSLRNFAPRVGFAYRPLGETFVIRGGYGIYTETLGRFARAQGGGPYQLSETFFNAVQSGQASFAFPNPFPVGAGSIASQSVTGFPSDTSNGRIHQFNLTLERQVKDIGLRLSYFGSRSRGLNYNIQIDKPEPSLIPFTQSRRPYPQFVGATFARHDGAANYNALTLEAQRKVGQVTFDAHWTWASNYNNTQNLENPYSPLLWSRDPFTTRHRVVLNAVWSLPFGRGKHFLANAAPVVNHVLGGWQLYWIAYLETGQYFSPSYSGSDASNTNTTGGLPDRIGNGNLPSGQRSITHWFDTSAFVRPAPGKFGNSGANVLEGPGLQEHNITVGKQFHITERFRFTFMAAAQNILNHPNFDLPAANISAPGSAGVISAVRGFAPARQIMLRGRVDF